MATVDFWFDYISPNAYLAWCRLPALAAAHDARIRTHPVLFAALLDASDRVGPAERPTTRRWMVLNCLRKAEALAIPFAPPSSHPFNPLLALRATIALDDGETRRRAIDALFVATWAEGRNVEEPSVVAAALDRAGLDGAALVEAARDDAVKSALREATAAAVDRGVFGVPTMTVGDELFWGFDDFPQLERHLAGDSSVTLRSLAAWRDVRPSARRPGGAARD